MTELERWKERANNLRTAFTTLIFLIVVVTGNLIYMHKHNDFDIYFIAGFCLDVFFVLLLVFVIYLMFRTEKRIEKL